MRTIRLQIAATETHCEHDGVLCEFPAAGCDGAAVRVIRLVEDGERVKDPAGNMGPQKYRADDVPAVDWNK